MFKAYEFTFAGVPASMYGMYLADIGSKTHTDNSFGNKANIVEKRIARRVRPLHFGVRYHDEPLSFTLIFGSDQEMNRYQMQEVAQWLTGYQEYQWLTIDQPDMEYIRFRCLIQTLTPISVGWCPFAFEAKVLCDSPYGYSYPFEETLPVGTGRSALVRNYSTAQVRLKPELRVSIKSGTRFAIRNLTTGDETVLDGLPAGGCSFLIDNENEVITTEDGINLYDGFNFRFFSMAPGDNELELEGNGEVIMSGMYLYNVGA